MWPQYIYLALSVLGLGFILAKHGQPQPNYNIVGSLIAWTISLTLLCYGGFFKGMM